MNLTTAKKALKFVIRAVLVHGLKEIPVPCLVGDSGIGKTTAIREVLTELVSEGVFSDKLAKMIEKHLAQTELGDLIGMVDIEKSILRTVWRPPCWWPEKDEEGLMFFDEFGDTRNDVQRAVQQLLLEKKLYEHILPKNMFIVLAMNPTSQDFGSFEFSRQLKNRIMFWLIQPDTEEWLAYATGNKNLISGVTQLIASDPNLLLDKVEFTVDHGYRNPRSITAAASLAKLMTPEEAKEFGWHLLSSICGPVFGSALLQLVEGSFDEDNLPINTQEILQGNLKKCTDKIKGWHKAGKNEMIHETCILIKSYLKSLSSSPRASEPYLNMDESERLASVLSLCPKENLLDVMGFMSREKMVRTMQLVASKDKKITVALKDILKHNTV